MTASEFALWDKIKHFELDDNQSDFKFSDRLARENRWHQEYATHVIEEYKKFIFLICISPGGVTPSDAVDQAWHLHLTFTKSYWIDFCKNTLNQEIHHHPTKGGNQEAQKYDSYYTRSLKLYTEKFGAEPPADIWQDNIVRFSDIDFQRVNLNTYALVKRSNIKKAGFWIVVIPIFILLLIFVDFEPALFIPLVAITVIAFSIYNSNGLNQGDKKMLVAAELTVRADAIHHIHMEDMTAIAVAIVGVTAGAQAVRALGAAVVVVEATKINFFFT